MGLNWKRFCWPMILKRRLKNNWLSMEKTEKTDCFVTILAAVVGLGCAPSGVGHKAAKLFVSFFLIHCAQCFPSFYKLLFLCLTCVCFVILQFGLINFEFIFPVLLPKKKK